MKSPRTCFGIALTLVLSGALASCGFKLRGAFDLPAEIRTVQVTAPSALRDDILLLLESGGVEVAPEGVKADARINVTGDRFDRRVLSVDAATGKEREFELAYTVNFAVTRRDGDAVIPDGSVNLLRDYVFDPEAVIGTSREEDLLREEMRRDAARQLMRRVEAAFQP